MLFHDQGLLRLEKYLNLEGFIEKSLKILSALKSTWKSLKKSPWILPIYVGLNTVDRELNQYKIVVPFVWCGTLSQSSNSKVDSVLFINF